MPSTAKRFMRLDGVVDERLDPYRATEASANLMLYNYRLLGTWPLAVTAYNHGPGGLRRAQDELGTSDIAVIVKRYQGKTFGFASRNFYVAFLAALEVDRNVEEFFGPLTRLPDTDSTPTELPDDISIDALAKAFKTDMGALRVLNPALRPPIWNGSRLVPRGYKLRLPGTPPESEIAAGWARVASNQRYLAQKNDGSHRLRRGETLAGVAAATGGGVARLLGGNSDTTNYEVAADNSVIVQAAETLGHFADWTRVDSRVLRTLNKLHKNAAVTQGAKLKLDFSHVAAAQFVAARREYHRGLQETY